MLGDGKAATNFGMGMTEIGAGVAVVELIANTLVIAQDAPALGLVWGIVSRHRSTR
jgi:hypothetical protein